jgi:hypothetical protein
MSNAWDDEDAGSLDDGTRRYGHNPSGAMYECEECGQRFRTPERRDRHQAEDADVCAERAALRPAAGRR